MVPRKPLHLNSECSFLSNKNSVHISRANYEMIRVNLLFSLFWKEVVINELILELIFGGLGKGTEIIIVSCISIP